MAQRARLTPPRPARTDWPWHDVESLSLRASLLFGGDRRMEAANFLAEGFGVRLAIESKATGWERLSSVATTWQPSRLKGIQVGPDTGTPFLTATQVYDVRPVPRKWLALSQTSNYAERFLEEGTIVVSCSGSVGRATLAHSTVAGVLVSHDLLRVDPNDGSWWGWLYAYLRAPTVRKIMKAAQYGHIIKHLETHHLDALPVLQVDEASRASFGLAARRILDKRNRAYALTLEAEQQFTAAFGDIDIDVENFGEAGFAARASRTLATSRRRFDAWHHNPAVKAIREHMSRTAVGWSPIGADFDVWLPTRFRRVTANDGVFLLDSSSLFKVNPDVTKRIADRDFGDRHNGRVKSGWILMSRSGQIYGLIGSAMIAGRRHEGKVVSDDVIRIAPRRTTCRVGYLLMAICHPKLGRHRTKALPYGSSIPHIEVDDVRCFEIPRLDASLEGEIADQVEEAARLQDEADEVEKELADSAEAVVAEFLTRRTLSG